MRSHTIPLASRTRALLVSAAPAAALALAFAASAPAQTYPTTSNCWGAVTGDVNGDGHADVVVSGEPNAVRIFLGSASGALTPSTVVNVGTIVNALDLADLNHDGSLDLVVYSDTSPAIGIRVCLWNGSTFGAAVPYPATGSTSIFKAHAVRDVNGDGHPDILVATSGHHTEPSEIVIRYGAGDGTFPTLASVSPSCSAAGNDALTSLGVADVTADGRLDLVTGHNNVAYMLTFFGQPNGTFQGCGSAIFAPGGSTLALALADVNHDGRVDLVKAEPSPLLDSRIGVFRWNPALPAWDAGGEQDVNGFAVSLAVGDVSATDAFDVFYSTFSPGEVVRFHGSAPVGGAATLAAPSTIAALAFSRTIEIADMNSDGHPDVVAAGGSDALFFVSLAPPANPQGIVLFGHGTPGCQGELGIGATSAPSVGNSSFAITSTNAPPNAVGLAIVTNLADVPGADPLGLGLLLHVNLVSSQTVVSVTPASDVSGVGIAAFPIPNVPGLAFTSFAAQTIWVEKGNDGRLCSDGALGLVSSRAMNILIAP